MNHNRWMRRAGPILYHPPSPDMTPCDYFVWGYLKFIVYHELPNNISEPKNKITEPGAPVKRIDKDALKNVYTTWI